MYNIEFDKKINVHFIGIGGISMSALAEILLSKGFLVSGSDLKESALTKKLEMLGAKIYYGHHKENITNDIDVVVHTAAVKEDNPELIEANNKNIPIITRAVLLGQIMKNYDTPIGVSGTHGKTTTTSMISQILIDSQKDPTILVGGMLDAIEGNIRLGDSQTFLTEACEYTNSFHSFFPKVAVILNISEDHMDFFNNLKEIEDSFKKYASLVPNDGTVVINSEIKNIDYIKEGLTSNIVTFGLNPEISDYSAINVTNSSYKGASFDLVYKGEVKEHIHLCVPGVHNILNALAATATCDVIGVDFKSIKKSLAAYTGCDRRFQIKGELRGITVIDDYAHHPDEINATLEVLKNYSEGKTWCVFQPHTYTRTNAFLKDFATSLSLADKIILTDIYAAREKNTIGISSKDLLNELLLLEKDAYYFPSFDEIETFLLENCKPGDLLITMGAGDVVIIGEKLLGLK